MVKFGWCAGRTAHERRCHWQREAVGEDSDQDSLHSENQPDNDVPDTQPTKSPFASRSVVMLRLLLVGPSQEKVTQM